MTHMYLKTFLWHVRNRHVFFNGTSVPEPLHSLARPRLVTPPTLQRQIGPQAHLYLVKKNFGRSGTVPPRCALTAGRRGRRRRRDAPEARACRPLDLPPSLVVKVSSLYSPIIWLRSSRSGDGAHGAWASRPLALSAGDGAAHGLSALFWRRRAAPCDTSSCRPVYLHRWRRGARPWGYITQGLAAWLSSSSSVLSLRPASAYSMASSLHSARYQSETILVLYIRDAGFACKRGWAFLIDLCCTVWMGMD
jgi:hypothetical protein